MFDFFPPPEVEHEEEDRPAERHEPSFFLLSVEEDGRLEEEDEEDRPAEEPEPPVFLLDVDEDGTEEEDDGCFVADVDVEEEVSATGQSFFLALALGVALAGLGFLVADCLN